MTSTIVPTPDGGVIRDCHEDKPSLNEIAVRVFEALSAGDVPMPHDMRFSESLRRVTVQVDSLDALHTWAVWLDADVRPHHVPGGARHYEAGNDQVLVCYIHAGGAS